MPEATNFGNYVDIHTDLTEAYNANPGGLTKEQWGAQHYANYGQAENRPLVVQPLPGTETGTDSGTTQPDTITPPTTSQTIQDYNAATATNPVLAPGTTLTPTLQTVNADELVSRQATGAPADVVAPTISAPGAVQAPDPIEAATVTAEQVGPATTVDESITDPYGTASAYEASLIGDQAAQGVAEQMEVRREATVKGQFEELMDFEAGDIPDWAKGAVRGANEAMAARGLGSSSIAAESITAALMQAALPIAAQDAATYFQADVTNMNARNTMALENLKNRQQALLTDSAAQNAALQFNASSEQQHSQFMANLIANIATGNADRIDAMKQFDAAAVLQADITTAQLGVQADIATAEITSRVDISNADRQAAIATANAQMAAAASQFNAAQAQQRQQFESEQALVVSQANAKWRRDINTANTASINAANAVNVANQFNMSEQATANLWQQWRDEASWANQAAENAADRAHNLAIAAMGRDTTLQLAGQQSEDDLWRTAGAFALNLIS